MAIALGVDIGGTGLKLALVNTENGVLATPRRRVPTPRPARPKPVSRAIEKLAALEPDISDTTPVGIGFPGVIRDGVAHTAVNLGKPWVGEDLRALGTAIAGRPAAVLNDADAAGLAEVRFGAARNERGLVAVITLGTGIGSALVYDGQLVPNSELGHIKIRGKIAEQWASAAVRKQEGLSWKAWARRVEEYLVTVDRLMSPDLVIVGGGVSKDSEQFLASIRIRPRIVPAQLRNNAGIVGAALWAAESTRSKDPAGTA